MREETWYYYKNNNKRERQISTILSSDVHWASNILSIERNEKSNDENNNAKLIDCSIKIVELKFFFVCAASYRYLVCILFASSTNKTSINLLTEFVSKNTKHKWQQWDTIKRERESR